MPNFVKISYQIKRFYIQELEWSDSATFTHKKLLGKKRCLFGFQIDISKTERIACVYTERRTGIY